MMGRSQFYGTPFEQKYGGSLDTPIHPRDIAAIIPWATDTNFYCPNGRAPEDYLLWISRPTDYKGLGIAIEVARRTRMPLKVSPGIGITEHSREFQVYKDQITQAISDGASIEIIKLPLNSKHHLLKRQLYRGARALIYPIGAHEPFGLVLIEALACGTPVIAYHRGAIPEIVQDNKTGFICETIDQLTQAVSSLGQINRQDCRDDAVTRFHYLVAASKYIRMLEN